MCCLTGHSRVQVIDGMVGALVEAARSGLRKTDKRYVWLDKARLARWDQVIAEPPRTDGLREWLTEAAADGGEDDLHDLSWFRHTAGRVREAAFNAGIPMDISGIAIRPSGFRVSYTAVPPAALRESTRPGTDRGYGIDLYCRHHNPAEFAVHIIDPVLYGNSIHENTDEHPPRPRPADHRRRQVHGPCPRRRSQADIRMGGCTEAGAEPPGLSAV